jgi:SHS2 domain-containing protein
VPGATHRFEESDELRLVIHAESFGSAVAEAGRALAELADGSPPVVAPGESWTEIEVHASDPAALLVEWLNELIFRAESEGWIAGEIQVVECSAGHVRARVRQRSWPSRTFPVKAATLDRARLESTPTGVIAEVTLDV